MFVSDKLNWQKNNCSKLVGEKMKAKEPQGDIDALPPGFTERFHDPESVTLDELRKLTVVQLKKLSSELDQLRNDYIA